MPEQSDASELEPLIGTWGVEAQWPGQESTGIGGSLVNEWLLGRRFVLQRSAIDHPEAPNGHTILAPDSSRPGGYLQHYFDSRGVVRLYEMSFDGREWTLERTSSDFSSLEFHQRYFGTLSEDGRTITGRWEISHDEGTTWELDFHLHYHRQD